jgi:hypothetical protein
LTRPRTMRVTVTGELVDGVTGKVHRQRLPEQPAAGRHRRTAVGPPRRETGHTGQSGSRGVHGPRENGPGERG